MRRVFVLLLVLSWLLSPRRVRAESAVEVARATGHLLADDDLFVDRGWTPGPLDGGGFVVSTRFFFARSVESVGIGTRFQLELVVQIPFERILTRRPRTPPVFDLNEEEPMDWKKKAGAGALIGGLAVAPAAAGKDKIEKLAVIPMPSSSASSSASVVATPPPTPLSATAMRALVAAAIHQAGLDRDDQLDSLATRARLSALAPEVRLRAYRGIDTGARVYRSDDLADRWTGSDGTTTLFEGRLSWRLDRLVFADEEVAIERIRAERAEAKQKLTGRVLELALRWQRARRTASDVEAMPHDRDEAAAISVETLVALDALTGGAASTILFSQGP